MSPLCVNLFIPFTLLNQGQNFGILHNCGTNILFYRREEQQDKMTPEEIWKLLDCRTPDCVPALRTLMLPGSSIKIPLGDQSILSLKSQNLSFEPGIIWKDNEGSWKY